MQTSTHSDIQTLDQLINLVIKWSAPKWNSKDLLAWYVIEF